MINYLETFPIPADILPQKLRELLTPIGLSPTLRIEVAVRQELNLFNGNSEYLHLQMAVVPEEVNQPTQILRETSHGVVAFSVPDCNEVGCIKNFTPSISGYDYIIASWGNGSFYSYNLSEKVWMALGLTPRCIGNETQKMIYDDLSLPEFDIAEGEISTSYNHILKKNIKWTMSNDYLRQYLWLRGARGVRSFFYQVQLNDNPILREIMNGQPHIVLNPHEGIKWYELDIREHKGKLLLQLWASIEALMPERCPEQNANTLIWPNDTQPMTYERANSLVESNFVYLDDRFLERYEQSIFYDTVPYLQWGAWFCSPSYGGQWAFTECQRIGRNIIKIPMRELYKPKPDREITHAYLYVITPTDLESINLEEEHIVSKIHKFINVLLDLGDNLSKLGESVGLVKSAEELIGFSREKIIANGWIDYPILSALSQVAPLDMTQQVFLTRCKNIHELLQKIPRGYLDSLLVKAGCPSQKTKDLGSLKLFQALLNIIQFLNKQDEQINAFESHTAPEHWEESNRALAPLFLNNELRIASAHDLLHKCIPALQELGFDSANLTTGYGRALDFMVDGINNSLSLIVLELTKLIEKN